MVLRISAHKNYKAWWFASNVGEVGAPPTNARDCVPIMIRSSFLDPDIKPGALHNNDFIFDKKIKLFTTE